MFKRLYELQVIAGIIKYLENYSDKDKDGILHLDCGNGLFAKELYKAGFRKYHGTTSSSEELKEAKALVPGFKTRFHKIADPIGAEALKHKHDIIISLGRIDYDSIPSGQRLVVVTEAANYDACCLKLSAFIAPRASTLQHGNFFVTYGERS